MSRPAIRFTWDENKNCQDLRKHDVRFETAVLVFADPYAITQRDVTFEEEKRWITVGAIGPGSILLVAHTFYEEHDEEVFVPSRLALPSPTKGELMKKLMKEAKRDIRTITAKRDQDIDFSDATAVLDWSGAEIGKVLSANEEARYDASGFSCDRMVQSRWPRLSD